MKEELTRVEKELQVSQEELEAKIAENSIVHMKIFEVKQDLQTKIDEIE